MSRASGFPHKPLEGATKTHCIFNDSAYWMSRSRLGHTKAT